jgi:xanthine dehydrogenase accessory factor
MDLTRKLVILRGGGDLATGAAYRLHKAGLPVIVLELGQPLVVRRRVALATAVLEGEVVVEGLVGRRTHNPAEALDLASTGVIPVLISPQLPDWPLNVHDKGSALGYQRHPTNGGLSPVSILIDARMAKRNIDTHPGQAPLVIALGPGFTAGIDCHAVVETMRGHRLGRVIWHGTAQPDTGTPGIVAGKAAERVLRAPVSGAVRWKLEIGDKVVSGEVMGYVTDWPVTAPFAGVVRGLIAPGTEVWAGLKIGDIDARGDVSACFTISDKALAVGGGVIEAILTSVARDG